MIVVYVFVVVGSYVRCCCLDYRRFGSYVRCVLLRVSLCWLICSLIAVYILRIGCLSFHVVVYMSLCFCVHDFHGFTLYVFAFRICALIVFACALLWF